MLLLDLHETLSEANHQSHKRYPFHLPPSSVELWIWIRYTPKYLPPRESGVLAHAALHQQSKSLAKQVGRQLASEWAADHEPVIDGVRVANLLTVSLEDAEGVYRGAGHRHAPDQRLMMRAESASPGLTPGPLTSGEWSLTVSAHTVVSPQLELSIQIGAEMAAIAP